MTPQSMLLSLWKNELCKEYLAKNSSTDDGWKRRGHDTVYCGYSTPV